jgi:hypothetical protein
MIFAMLSKAGLAMIFTAPIAGYALRLRLETGALPAFGEFVALGLLMLIGLMLWRGAQSLRSRFCFGVMKEGGGGTHRQGARAGEMRAPIAGLDRGSGSVERESGRRQAPPPQALRVTGTTRAPKEEG